MFYFGFNDWGVFVAILLAIAAAALAQGSTAASPTGATDPNKRICKRTVDTGSLVRGKRVCRTRAEWDRLAEAARAGGQDMVDRHAAGTRY